ncbi:hypothetical protein [Bacillus inaquosorum]|uniref:hypothetical protein n=1 Tax=Bacillus inaquosorum TaxID=483913 RepID=UPI0022802717|nr:hypothetical protein [Bacillus inaquosorum]MCY8798279.1 hypothetical protein [Bacillus inaquosorum]MEC0773032.1 hypothetical protein [Bacillus inaquosorum]MEC0796919.1 hypothetical protein [Bacillus inaquosorum]
MSTVLERKINNFTSAVEKSIESENWHSALALALTLPDICGNLQDPDRSSSRKYISFFNDFLKDKYTRKIGASMEEREFLNGKDMYALRCSFLHAGEIDISRQSIRNVLDGYIFFKPDKFAGDFVHRNRIDNKLQLRIDAFCMEIIEAVNAWVKAYSSVQEIQDRAELMIDIIDPSNGFRI